MANVAKSLVTNPVPVAMVPPLAGRVFAQGSRTMRRVPFTTSAVLVVGLMLYGCHWTQSRKTAPDPQAQGQQLAAAGGLGQLAPDIDGEGSNGQRLHLADYKGDVVVLSFWANY
jgi:cytochrome oxidase Cu insertion factor (SCO1/SenC/PrrC family)